MVLGAVLPEMREKVEDAGAATSPISPPCAKRITAERDRLKAEIASLDKERTRMAALIAERQKQQAEREKALAAERNHAAELAHQVDNLKDLIGKLEARPRPGNPRRARGRPQRFAPALSAFRDPGRLAPAVAFASTSRTCSDPG